MEQLIELIIGIFKAFGPFALVAFYFVLYFLYSIFFKKSTKSIPAKTNNSKKAQDLIRQTMQKIDVDSIVKEAMKKTKNSNTSNLSYKTTESTFTYETQSYDDNFKSEISTDEEDALQEEETARFSRDVFTKRAKIMVQDRNFDKLVDDAYHAKEKTTPVQDLAKLFKKNSELKKIFLMNELFKPKF